MKWSVFSLSQIPDQAQRVAAFEADLRLFELAETLGFDKVWIAEHLFSTYGVVTSTQVYAAAIAQRTKRLRIGLDDHGCIIYGEEGTKAGEGDQIELPACRATDEAKH